MKRFLLLLLMSSSAAAQDLSGFEKILFPVLGSSVVHGAYGSTFETRLRLFTPSDVAFYPSEGSTVVLHPQTWAARVPFDDQVGTSRGRFLFFEKGIADQVAFGYTLISSTDTTQLPVVRERDYRTGTTYIVDVPMHPVIVLDPLPHSNGEFKQRNTIRIYDVDNTGKLDVEVLVRALPISATFVLGTLRADRREGDGPTYPTYGELAYSGPCISFGNNCQDFETTVELRPTNPDIRYWAFLSSTDNASQYVTIRTAQ
jgi:hypothetical protein